MTEKRGTLCLQYMKTLPDRLLCSSLHDSDIGAVEQFTEWTNDQQIAKKDEGLTVQ